MTPTKPTMSPMVRPLSGPGGAEGGEGGADGGSKMTTVNPRSVAALATALETSSVKVEISAAPLLEVTVSVKSLSTSATVKEISGIFGTFARRSALSSAGVIVGLATISVAA